MKLKPFAPLILGCLLGILPALAFGVPWDPDRSRPAGFQRTLAYLENDLYDYPQAELQSIRNKILHDDLVTTLLPQLKAWGEPPSRWAELVQQQLDQMRTTQYEALKNIIRQTMTNPEGIIQAVEGNQPIEGTLLEHPNVKALIGLKWQMLNIAEQTYQALIHEGLLPGGSGGGRPSPPTDISPPKPGKGKPGLDWERMRESRRRAIERRRAFEELWAREAARRQAELNILIEQLIGLRPKSSSKFQARPIGGYVSPAATEPEPAAADPDQGPPPTIEAIEKIEEEIAEAEEKMEEEQATEKKPAEKVTVYRGTLILRRSPDWSDDNWKIIKDAFKDALAKPPGTTDMNDKGDEVTWRYKLLKPGGYPLKSPLIQDIPDKETTEEDAEDNKQDEKPEPKFTGNGDADMTEKDVPGSGPSATTTPPPAPKTKTVYHEHWFDPTDKDAKKKDPFIYIRIDGRAERVQLSDAKYRNLVPPDATPATMTNYSDRKKEILEDKGTHDSLGGAARSTNKFAKPKG